MKKVVALLFLCMLCAGLIGSASAEGIAILLEEMQQVDTAVMERVNAAIQGYILKESERGLTADVQAELLQGGTLLAVRYDFVLDSDGPHARSVIAAQHFDLSTGMQVALSSLTHDLEALRRRVTDETLRVIAWEGFGAFDDAGTRAAEWPLEQALLTGDGLLAFYNEGELGPVSEGALEVLLPYGQIVDLLDSGLMYTRAVSVAYAPSRALPKDAYTGGDFLWMADAYNDNHLLAFTANEALTDVAFCAVEHSGEDEYPALGRVFWKLPDMKPGDTAYLLSAFADDFLPNEVSRIAIRYRDAAGASHGAVPCLAYTDGDFWADGELALMHIAVTEAGEPVDRAAVEAEVKALYEAYERVGDEETLGVIIQKYMDVLARNPWAAWAHLGLGKAQIIARDSVSEWWDSAEALGALNAAISLGETGAEAYYLRAMAHHYAADEMYGGFLWPGEEGWPMFLAAVSDMERAIETKPEHFPYDCDQPYGAMLNAAGRYGEAMIIEAKAALRDAPEDEDVYRDLIYAYTSSGWLDAAAEAIDALRALQQPRAGAPVYRQADEAYEAGEYGGAIRLYREAIEDGDDLYDKLNEFPARVWYRLADAYMQLGRYKEAAMVFEEMTEWYPAFEEPAVFFNQRAEALLAEGRIDEARMTIYESFDLWHNVPGQEMLAKIDVMLPAGAEKVFEGGEWAGYEPAATAFYDWPVLSTVVTVMRKDGHNVLCVLETPADVADYRLVVANDRAVYQGDDIPELYIDDAWGSIYVEYADEDLFPIAEGYTFCTRWFWEEEMGETAHSDWAYALLEAYRVYPEPHDPDYAYYDRARLSMDFAEGKSRLQGRWEPYGDSPEPWETLAEIELSAVAYDLAVFDIGQCNEDFERLAEMAYPENIQYYTGWAASDDISR